MKAPNGRMYLRKFKSHELLQFFLYFALDETFRTKIVDLWNHDFQHFLHNIIWFWLTLLSILFKGGGTNFCGVGLPKSPFCDTAVHLL